MRSLIRRALPAFARQRPIVFCLLALILFQALSVARYLIWPPISILTDHNPPASAFILYRQRQWRAEGKDLTPRQTWVEYRRISPHLRQAVVIAEDDLFWTHQGFDWRSIHAALNRTLSEGRFSAGGSSITQQLAKNLYLSPDRSITRKVQEAILTWRLERSLSKERLLELYLNVAEWGEGVFGAEAAARHYFKRSAANLTRRQAAVLAAMLPAPLVRSPGSRHVQRVASVIERRMR